MNIIPHRQGNIQVVIDPQREYSDIPESLLSVKDVGLSTIQREALRLFDAGLNVFPQPIGRKGGYAWKRLQHTRLVRNDKRYGLRKVFAGTCNIAVMCGKTSNNLFMIDCESNTSLSNHLDQMRQRQIPIWAVKTARGGHIYLRANSGEVENIPPGVLQDAEIKGQQGYVLGPGSVHPNGDVYTWICREGDLPPAVNSAEVNWLTDRNGFGVRLSVSPNTTRHYVPGAWARPSKQAYNNLSRSTQEYLDCGATLPEGTRNNRLFSAACDLNGNGHGEDETRNLLVPIARASGLYPHEIDKTLASAYSKRRTPARPARKQQRDVPNEDWYHALLFGIEHTWSGRSRSSQRACFLALVERCRVAGNENGVFRASIREIAALARLGTATVQKRLREFLHDGLLVRCGSDQQSQASLWHFDNELLKSGKQRGLKMDTVALSPHWLSYSVSVFNSDSVERGAVGHSVMFVYEYLKTCDEPLMPSELAERMGITVNQANYALRKLRHFSLVERDYEGWVVYVLSPQELDDYMEDYVEVKGKGAARKARFAAERALFAARMAFFGREAAEGKSFRDALHRMLPNRLMLRYEREVMRLLNEPAILCALELGGITQLQDGHFIRLE